MQDFLIDRPSTRPRRDPEYAWSQRGWPIEFPGTIEDGPQVYCYTDKYSYAHGETIQIHATSTTKTFDVTIVKDGARPTTVFERTNVPGRYTETPRDCYQIGSGWPVLLTVPIDPQWESGFYLIIVKTWDEQGELFEREHFFVLRPRPEERRPLVLIMTTSTMNAYNDWGGANLYQGLPLDNPDPRKNIGAAVVSTQRPLARGMLRLPPGYPREADYSDKPPFWRVRFPVYEWARFHGYSPHFNDAFWATYERPFVVWMEEVGYELDIITQQDLDEDPHILDGHRCAIAVGHDEYYSEKMRSVLDKFLEVGNNFARFGGNIFNAARMTLGNNGTTQARGSRADGSAPQEGFAEPVNSTFGLHATGYLRYGNTGPRSPAGYLIYRPNHWTLSGTDLYYGDLLGGVPVGIAAFELDGILNDDWQMKDGLPVVTANYPHIENLEIIGMLPIPLGDEDRWEGMAPLNTGFPIAPQDNNPTPRMACMVTYQRGGGTGFNAGTCEWVQGLIKRDWYVEKVTHNILSRLAGIPSLAPETVDGHITFPVGGDWHPQ